MIVRRELRACRRAAENEVCRVCEETAHGFHFGVMVCRACAAFFRRTVALNMHYHCRFDRNCQIDKSVRCMCRSCRHSKCLRVGMRSDAVQLNRDVIKMKEDDVVPSPNPISTIPAIPSTSSVDSNSTTSILSRQDEVENELFTRINLIFEDALQNPRTSTDLTSVEMFRLGMNHVRQRRQAVHTEKLFDLTDYYGSDTFVDLLKDNWSKVSDMASNEVDLHAELLAYNLPFLNLPAHQRWLYFKNFSMAYISLERAYETYRILGDDLKETNTVTFNGQIINFLGALLHEKDRLSHSSEYQTVISIFKPARMMMQRGLINPIKELKPSEIEFAALANHLLWLNPCNESVSEDVVKTATFYRRQVFSELHNYYVESLGMNNYASRLGDFMALMAVLEKSVFQKRENIRIAEVFSLGKVNSTMMSLLMK